MQAQEDLLQNNLYLEEKAQAYLKDAAQWAKFLAVCGFIAGGLLLIPLFFAGALLRNFPVIQRANDSTAFLQAIYVAIILLVAVIIFTRSVFLYRFASKMSAGIANNDPQTVTVSLPVFKTALSFREHYHDCLYRYPRAFNSTLTTYQLVQQTGLK